MRRTVVGAEVRLGGREEDVRAYYTTAHIYPMDGGYELDVPEGLSVHLTDQLVISGPPDRVLDLLRRGLRCGLAKLSEARELNTAEVK